MRLLTQGITVAACIALSSQALSFDIMHGKIPIQIGGFTASQGATQNINIQGLIGDHYTVAQRSDQNFLFGLGYYIDGPDRPLFNMTYGVNAFYLAKTSVSGTIFQEHLYPNLAYKYSVTNVPIYAAAKAEIKNDSNKYAVTLDAGIGPNLMNTSGYNEQSLDGGITIPDHAFSGRSSTTFSAMAGIGIKMKDVFGHAPLECGYRFFYLGRGTFNKQTDQLINTLATSDSYAQALICSVTVL